MLIKVRNDSPEFEVVISDLKKKTGIATNSKIAELCIGSYIPLISQCESYKTELELLQVKYGNLIDAIKDRNFYDDYLKTAVLEADA